MAARGGHCGAGFWHARIIFPPCPPPRAVTPSPPRIGGVPVGSGHPIVVQSMTNTDTADVAGDGATGRRAGARRQRAGAGDGQQRGRGGGGPAHRRGAGHRWASRSRSSATSTTTATCCSPGIPTAPGPWPSTGSIPATSAASGRRELPRHHRGRARERQAGADRGQLGLARPEPADRDDGRQRPPAGPPRRARRDHGGDGRERPPVRGAGRGLRDAARPDHPQRQGVRGAGSGRRLPHAGRTLRLSASPGAHRGRTRRQGHHREHRGSEHPAAGGHR